MLEEITETDAMRRKINKNLMVAWINRDLIQRAAHDVRKSYVLYDLDKMFVGALFTEPDEESSAWLSDHTAVCYWSKGIV